MPRNQEIVGVFLGEKIRFDETVIGQIEIEIGATQDDDENDGDQSQLELDLEPDANRPTIKGKAEPEELERGTTYRFFGHWTNYHNKRFGTTERQFHFNSFVVCSPLSRKGVIEYIARAGSGRGIGKARAGQLYDRFHSDAVRVLREEPEAAHAALGGKVSLADIQATSEWLWDQYDVEQTTIELIGLLDGRGFPKSVVRECIREWGAKAAEIVRRHPYALMNFRGCGFLRCDELYLSLGHDPARLRRQAFCLWYAIAKESTGDTWFDLQKGFAFLRSAIGWAAKPERALEMAIRIGRLPSDYQYGALECLATNQASGTIVCRAAQESDPHRWIAEGKKARHEDQIAAVVVESETKVPDWPAIGSVKGIDDHQRDALRRVLTGQICSLGGSPGTGKTYTAAALIRACIEKFGQQNMAIAAPTGKAAVRITEAMRANGIVVGAQTWHSLLGVKSSDSGGWSFEHNRHKPFSFKIVVGDESSMNDAGLMASILEAKGNALMLFVGDVNQLAPVGHGAPLRDMIAAGIPHGELTEIKRNSGGIVEACAAIRDGQEWTTGDNLILRESRNPERQRDAIIASCRNAQIDGLDPIWDCQVLVAVNQKSKVSRQELNSLLQRELNSDAAPHKSIRFRIGDKVVNGKNGFQTWAKESEIPFGVEGETSGHNSGQVYVANGELGEVVEITESGVVFIRLEISNKIVKLVAGKKDKGGEDDDATDAAIGSWDLGYALTVHKAQGSEWPRVQVVLDQYPGAGMICDRSWIYTAISRAKEQCELHGQLATAFRFCQRTAIGKRKTFLAEKIRLLRAKRVLSEI